MSPVSLEPPYGARDPRDMAALVDALPEHIEQSLARLAAEPWRAAARRPSMIAVGGMGGSAIAGELTAATYADALPQPMLVVRDYRLPACVDRDALLVLSSNSGNTEETLALAAEAAARGVPCVALASGGTLAELAGRHGWPLHRVPGGMPPRAALFHAWVPLTTLLAGLGAIADPVPDWREAVALLRAERTSLGVDSPEGANPAKQLARAVAGRTLYVYSGTGPLAAVATRWRQQFAENGKLLAHSATVPELNHNEIVGWQVRGPVTEDIAVLVLRDVEDSAAVQARLDLTAEYAARQGAAVHTVHSKGTSRLARLASLVQFGDALSLYLALLGGADPTDIASIDEFKRRLAERAAR